MDTAFAFALSLFLVIYSNEKRLGKASQAPPVAIETIIFAYIYSTIEPVKIQRPAKSGPYFLRSERMNALQLAKKYRCRLNYIYQVLYDLEAKGLIEPDRKRSRLSLNEKDGIILEKELQRREYRRLAMEKGD